MFRKQIDILSIGDITTDAFIRLKDAHVHCRVNREDCELCLRFGDKVPFEYVKIVRAVGNAANATVTAARLGLNSALVANIGDDENGHECLTELQRNKVVTSFVKVNPHKPTNYHFVLWYDVDRTILVNHIEYDYHLPKLPAPKWIYLTSVGANTHSYHLEIMEYLNANPKVKLAFQPGTYQIKLGYKELRPIFERADVFVTNFEEAERILENAGSIPKKSIVQNQNPEKLIPQNQALEKSASPSQTASSASFELLRNKTSRDVKLTLKSLSDLGPKLVVITDGPRGAYLFDGDHYYHMPIYPDPRPPLERTGCGDAWASTFVSALAMGKTPLEALMIAPVNPMSVAQFIGSQEGLLKLDQMEWWLKRAPEDYKPREI